MMRSVRVWGFILSRCLHIRCHCSFGCFCCLGMPQCFFVFVKFLELISQNLHRKRFFVVKSKPSCVKIVFPCQPTKQLAVVIEPSFSSVLLLLSYILFGCAAAMQILYLENAPSIWWNLATSCIVWSKPGFSFISTVLFHSAPLKPLKRKTTFLSVYNCALMLFLCLALSVPGVQAVQGNEETALSGAYALMGLSKVIGSIADDSPLLRSRQRQGNPVRYLICSSQGFQQKMNRC